MKLKVFLVKLKWFILLSTQEPPLAIKRFTNIRSYSFEHPSESRYLESLRDNQLQGQDNKVNIHNHAA